VIKYYLQNAPLKDTIFFSFCGVGGREKCFMVNVIICKKIDVYDLINIQSNISGLITLNIEEYHIILQYIIEKYGQTQQR